MSTIAERIIQIVDEKEGGNKRQFALKTKMTPSYVSQLSSHSDMVPSDRVLDKIIVVYGVNREWLYAGIGEPFPEPSLGEAMGEIAAEAAQNNVEAVRKFFRELGDEFSDAEILFLYQIFKAHFGGKPQEEKSKNNPKE